MVFIHRWPCLVEANLSLCRNTTTLRMSQCPKCSGQQLVAGCLSPASKPPIFRPAGLRSFSVTQDAGTKFTTAEALACLDCGLVWTDLPAMKLREFVQRHCRDSGSVELSQCLNCHSNRVARGKIITEHRGIALPAVFDPSGRQAFTFTLGGTRFTSEAMACLDCGFAWTSTSSEKLRRFIQKHCDQTPGNAVAFEGAKPPSAWKEMWIGGIGVALIPVGYGVYCLYTGHAYFPRRRGPVLDLQGWEAVVLAVAYIAFGAFLHFQFFWGRHPRLSPWSLRLKKAALLVGGCGIGYALLRRIF